MGPKTFTGEFAWFHAEFWDWYWPLIRRKQRGESIIGIDEYLAYLLLLGRGNGKSSCMEWAVIAAGALLGSTAVTYTSATETLAVEHLTAITHRVETPTVAFYYPGLSEARIGKYGTRAGWNKSVLKTKSGLTVYAVGLNQEVRGLKDLDLRIGLEVFDDFDSRNDSPDIVKKKEGQIGGTILPMGLPDTIKIMGQNIIHENSLANRIFKRHSPILSHRKESGIIPAFSNVKIKPAPPGSSVHPNGLITKGRANWQHFNMAAAQTFLDDSGEPHWMAEYQHSFDLQKEGLVFSNYTDEIQVITWSEFESVYGSRRIPRQWNKYIGHDWARTKSALHANVVSYVAISDQNTAVPGRIFLFNLLTFEPNTEADEVGLAMLKAITPTVPMLYGNESPSWDDLAASALNRDDLQQYVNNTTDFIRKKRVLLSRVIPEYTSAAVHDNNYKALRMSHEAKGPFDVYEKAYGLKFDKINPGADGGADTVDFLMQIDHSKPHPFRPGKTGDSRFFLVVDDDDLPPPKDLKPEKIHGMALARYQFMRWRWLAEKITSEGVQERGPQKMNDDVGNSLQMLFFDNLPRARELTHAEMIEEAIPEGYRRKDFQARSPVKGFASPQDQFAYQYAKSRAEQMVRPDFQTFDLFFDG
jgi:hypothetical protein